MSDAYSKEKASQNYMTMSTAEKWKWHARIYAFRRVILNVNRDEITSPCDVEGKWFNEQMAVDAEYALRQTGRMRSRSHREGKPYGSDAAGGRAVKEAWCRKHGYQDFPDYMNQIGLDFADDEHYAEACKNIAVSIIRAGQEHKQSALHEKRVEINDRFDAARSLGVTAREYSPDEMRAGRIALGIEQAAKVEAAE